MKKKTFLTILAVGASMASALASQQDENPLWLRSTAISPNGQTIAFTYHGDIFTVPVGGGTAKQITSNSAYDTAPVWSPDGTMLAFASDRRGSMDVFVVDANGGTPQRLTTHSGSEKPLAFLNDSTILFSAALQPAVQAAQGAFQGQVYKVGVKGGRPTMFSTIPMLAASVGPDGRVLYQDKKGYENTLRKHERSSGTSDIWLIDNGKYTQLTNFNGHDQMPVWAPGKDSFYYVSEQDGTLNVYSRNLKGEEKQLTKHQRHPVRSLSASSDGKTLAYSWDGEIYTLAPGGEPQKVEVKIYADDYDADIEKGYRSSGATDMAVSPSGEEVAFVMRGDVYVTSVKYKTTKRITNTDAQERNVSFSPDGRSLVYDSERDGIWQLFIAKIKDDKDKNFTYAAEVVEEPLYKGEKTAQQPVFSPDGKKVAFLEDRVELKVIDIDSKAVNTALDGKYNYSYADGDLSFAWSPDSRWLVTDYIGVGGWNNSDVALVRADGSEVIDLTESGYADNLPKFALDGKAVTFVSGKYGYKSHGSWGEQLDVFLMALDGEAWDTFNLTEEEAALKEKAEADAKENAETDDADKKKKKDKKDKKEDEPKVLAYDTANRHHRTARLTGLSSHMADYWLSPKGDKLYYVALGSDGEYSLMVVDTKKGDISTLTPGIAGGLVPSKEGDNLFVISRGSMKKVSLPAGTVEAIEFEAPFERTPSAEREYIYDHAWRQVKDKFYDADLHNVDWEQYGQDYRKFLPYINNNYDFAELLSELLGELNASHTGGYYYPSGSALRVAELGAFFDEAYDGDGLKVIEVIARGPLDTNAASVKPGDVILSIDGQAIEAGKDYYPLLEGKTGKKVRLGIQRSANGAVDYVSVKPISSTRDLLYQRWVEHNEQVVDSLSDGKIGYVHVKGMDSESFREVYSKLLGKYRNCEAVVVDTRYNGGGWLHNDIALLLSGKEYVRYSPRGKYIGADPFSQWTKPSVMLVNESNYSDAHATPYVYQTLGIGKVIGAPVPGTMTAVWWETQIDPTLMFGIPQVTSLDANGKPLENQQLNPDILIYNNPADVAAGIDDQLIQAVKALKQ